MADHATDQKPVFSKRTHFICLASSIFVYCLILAAINRSALLDFSSLTLSGSEQLPSSYVEGTLHFSEGGRNHGSSIVVWLSGGGTASFICRGVNWEQYPHAIPCREEGYAQINGKAGRLWFLERTGTSRLFGKSKSRLAVQLLVFPDKLYPFAEQKAAILAAQESAKHNPISLFLRGLIHCLGVLAILVLSWGVADRLLTARSRPTPSLGPP